MPTDPTPAGAAAGAATTGPPPRREAPRLAPDPVRGERRFDAPVTGGRVLAWFERAVAFGDGLLGRLLPAAWNPFLHTGAVATASLLVAAGTGILLLFWYRPSAHQAYASVAGMMAWPRTLGLLRSLHRYGSDAAALFTALHTLRLVLERRFTGTRWLAWLTGTLATALLWFVGWTGYWLVWDARAHAIAVGTARAIDTLPLFADPLSRSFLTDRALNSLLFFVVFFVHMLVPLAVGLMLWLHLVRVARPRWVTHGALTLWTAGLLLGLSLVRPADLAAPAHMTSLRGHYAMDAWYLLPVALTDRLSGGALWALFLAGGAALGCLPWVLGRRGRGAATIDASKCFACNQCAHDCPFNAIAMVPRTSGDSRHATQALVDPARCAECGICASSCDSGGTNLPWLPTLSERRRVEEWMREASGAGEAPWMVFACAHSAGGSLDVDATRGLCRELPGARVLRVPCAGWTHTMTVERALRTGAKAVAIVACGPGRCSFREGDVWLQERLDGRREPALRADKVSRDDVRVLRFDAHEREAMLRALRGGAAAAARPPGRAVRLAAAAGLAVALGLAIGAGSIVGYASPRLAGSELVVTFVHAGRVVGSRERTAAELEKLPVQMRSRRVESRERAPVRLRVWIDGRRVLDRRYAPRGVARDLPSVAIERVPVPVGTHDIDLRIGDGPDPNEWTFGARRRLAFDSDNRRVVAFDHVRGFVVE